MGVRVLDNADRGCSAVVEKNVDSQTRVLIYPLLSQIDSLNEDTFCKVKELMYRFDSNKVIQDSLKQTDPHLASMIRIRAVDFINEYIEELKAASEKLYNGVTDQMKLACQKVDKYIGSTDSSKFQQLFDKFIFNPCEANAKKRELDQLKAQLNFDDIFLKGSSRATLREEKRRQYFDNPKNKQRFVTISKSETSSVEEISEDETAESTEEVHKAFGSYKQPEVEYCDLKFKSKPIEKPTTPPPKPAPQETKAPEKKPEVIKYNPGKSTSKATRNRVQSDRHQE